MKEKNMVKMSGIYSIKSYENEGQFKDNIKGENNNQ